MTPEGKIQAKIKRILEGKGYTVVKVIQLSRNGYPDIMAMKDGRTVWVEAKAEGQKPRPTQLLRLRQLRDNGFTAFWTDLKINADILNNI